MSRRSPHRYLGLFGLVFTLAAAPATSAPENGPFGTREQSATAPGLIIPLAISAKKLTPHDRAASGALSQKLQSLYALASRTPVLQQMRGFSLEPVLYTDANDGKAPLSGGLSLYFRPVYLDWASTRVDPQSGRYFTPHPNDGISFLINQPERLLGEELGRDAQGSFHTAPELLTRGNGWLEHRSHKYHLLVHVGNGRLPYRPITIERYLTHSIRQVREAVASQADEGVPAHAADAIPTREQLLAELKQTGQELLASGMGKEEVTAMLAPMRESLEDYSPVGVDGTELNALAAAANDAGRNTLQALEAELAALSPAQRQAPACQYLGEPKYVPLSGLDIHCSDPRGLIVEANPDFFDPKLPRDAVQLLAIHYFPRRGNNGAFSYLDIAQTVMEALSQEQILAALR